MNTTKQKDNRDFHSWNVNNKNIIIDNPDMNYLKFVAIINFQHNDFELIYKEWTSISPHYQMKTKESLNKVSKLDKKEKLEVLKANHSHICNIYSALRNDLFKYDIKYGSLGIKCKRTGTIFWEFGNGKDISDF